MAEDELARIDVLDIWNAKKIAWKLINGERREKELQFFIENSQEQLDELKKKLEEGDY